MSSLYFVTSKNGYALVIEFQNSSIILTEVSPKMCYLLIPLTWQMLLTPGSYGMNLWYVFYCTYKNKVM